MQPDVGWEFHSSPNEGVDHDALWVALLNEVRQPGAHATNSSFINCDGFFLRGSLMQVHSTCTSGEEEWDVVCRHVVDGKESQSGCAVGLRGPPLKIEVCREESARRCPVHSKHTKSEASVLVVGLCLCQLRFMMSLAIFFLHDGCVVATREDTKSNFSSRNCELTFSNKNTFFNCADLTRLVANTPTTCHLKKEECSRRVENRDFALEQTGRRHTS